MQCTIPIKSWHKNFKCYKMYFQDRWGKLKDCIICLVAQSCPTLHDPMDCSPSGSSVHGDSSGKNTGVGCHALLQGIFPTQGLNPGLLHCWQILYHLSHQGSRRMSNSLFRYSTLEVTEHRFLLLKFG